MNAFETKGLAYLLKPFSKKHFNKDWQKFLLFRNSTSDENKWLLILKKF